MRQSSWAIKLLILSTTLIRVGSTIILKWGGCTATVIDCKSFTLYLRKIYLLYFVLFFLIPYLARAKPEKNKQTCNSSRIRQCAIMTNNPVGKTDTYLQEQMRWKTLQTETVICHALVNLWVIYLFIPCFRQKHPKYTFKC